MYYILIRYLLFNIILIYLLYLINHFQMERRLVNTMDPQFPSLTFSGTLPRLVVHINEQKISALRAMLSMITDQANSSPYRSPDAAAAEFETDFKVQEPADQDVVDEPSKEMSKLILMQFIVQQLALEVYMRRRKCSQTVGR